MNSAADSINKMTRSARSNRMKSNESLSVPEYGRFNSEFDQLLLSPKRNNAIKTGPLCHKPVDFAQS